MIVQPDYENSIYNITQSIKRYYGLDHHKTLNLLDDHLSQNKKNVILLVLDGLGQHIVKSLLPEDSWLRSNTKGQITSVYPSTTTAAMTTYYSGKTPIEHGWLGWTLYFKEYARIVDTFINTDSFTGLPIGEKHAAQALLKYETIFDQIMTKSSRSVQTYSFNPRGILVAEHPTINVQVDNFYEMVRELSFTAKEPGQKFMMAYWSQPDHSLHSHGLKNPLIQDILLEMDEALRHLSEELEDTILIVSADHGLVDIEEKFYINEYETLNDCLIMPPSIETRCASFFIKKDMHDVFETNFNKHFGDHFQLYTKAAFLEAGYLGHQKPHKKIDDFVGDYVALATGRAMLKYNTLNQAVFRNHKANHAGLLAEEMWVPLIIHSS